MDEYRYAEILVESVMEEMKLLEELEKEWT